MRPYFVLDGLSGTLAQEIAGTFPGRGRWSPQDVSLGGFLRRQGMGQNSRHLQEEVPGIFLHGGGVSRPLLRLFLAGEAEDGLRVGGGKRFEEAHGRAFVEVEAAY